jgi:fermentation-respiration switch protein FrsA (DUF1100 family)
MFRAHAFAIVAGLLSCVAGASAQTAPGWFTWRPGQYVENSLLFHPVRDSDSWVTPPAWLRVQDVWLTSSSGHRIHAWWCPSPTAHGAVLFCHGNAGNLSHRCPIVIALMQSLGQSVLIFDYPGYGKSAGQPSEAGCYAAADAAYDWLVREQGIVGNQIVLFGESLGGGVAVDLAARHEHRALVLVKTFASIPDMARERWSTWSSSPLVRNRFDSVAKIKNCKAPIFVAHGDRDRVIPLAEAKKLYEAAPTPKKFFLLQGSDHNDPLPPAFYDALAAFVRNSD